MSCVDRQSIASRCCRDRRHAPVDAAGRDATSGIADSHRQCVGSRNQAVVRSNHHVATATDCEYGRIGAVVVQPNITFQSDTAIRSAGIGLDGQCIQRASAPIGDVAQDYRATCYAGSSVQGERVHSTGTDHSDLIQVDRAGGGARGCVNTSRDRAAGYL